MALDYIRFFEEQLEAKGLKKSQAPDFIKMETGFEITVQQAYEFLDTKREFCPGTVMTKVWELAFRVNLHPRYYGAGSATKGKSKA